MFLAAALFTFAIAWNDAPSTAIRVDQVGYPSAGTKFAIVAAQTPASHFSVVNLATGGVVLEGSLPAATFNADTGERVQLADFSAVTSPGRYELRIDGVGRSWPFEIGEMPYARVLRLTTRAYYGQRCGTAVDLGSEFPGYSHPACHLAAAFHVSSGGSGSRPASGGWHDAGDYGRYVVNSGISTATLLWSWELFPEAFARLNLAIPESADNTPDLLDEIRWNLEWMLSMQDEDGGVWQKQTTEQFAGWVAPQNDRMTSYVIGTGIAPFKSSCATADFAAVMAIAARVYRPYDPQFADQALDRARQAWSWLDAYPNVVFCNPPGVGTGEYGDSDCSDERLWAAAEIWRASRDVAAGAYFVSHAAQALNAIRDNDPPAWPSTGALAAWTYALGGGADAEISESIRRTSLEAADRIVARARTHGYRTPMTARDYVWGSNAVAANYGLQLLVANRFQPNRLYVDATLEIVHYLLGRNAFSLSWVTAAGANAVKHPHHAPSVSDGIGEPWPGMLAGGPNKNRDDSVLRALPANLPPALVYSDHHDSYAGNEIAINWNAPLVFVLAGVSADQQPPKRRAIAH